MTDREERQHVIEVLQKMVDWMEAVNYIVATPDRRHALLYAIASIETDLKYDLLHEETGKQADKSTAKNDVPDNNVGEITTKKDLVVDAVSRKAVLNKILKFSVTDGRSVSVTGLWTEVNDLPSVTPQEPIEKCKWIKYDHRTMCPKEHIDVDSPYWRIPENRMNALKYCPYCGKEIEVEA